MKEVTFESTDHNESDILMSGLNLQKEENKITDKEEEKEKVILIIGVTCSGKTKFSIDLCKELSKYQIHCEIINADSMQVYQGFHVGNAKIKEEEMEKVKHHILDVCTEDESFNVNRFINQCIPIIKDLNENHKLPLVVGGTMLYVESLLWESVADLACDNKSFFMERDLFEKKTKEELYEELKLVDAERAKQLHVNDRKRICRSLEIFYTQQKKHSELIQLRNHKNHRVKNMRYSPCFFYLDIENEETHKREIINRVDKMIEDGLLEEAMKLKELTKNKNYEFFKGIHQSIAYKEFDPYLEKKRNNEEDEPLFQMCRDNLIKKTIQYAKKQRRWILNRFIKRYEIPINKIDVSNNYEQQLRNSVQIILDYLQNSS